MKGIRVTLKDGTIEHYDPVPVLVINNTFYAYEHATSEIDKIEIYDTEEGDER